MFWRKRQPATPEVRLGRVNTFWLIAATTLCAAPLALHLDLWMSLALATLLLWRTQIALSSSTLPSKWLLAPLTLLAAAAVLATQGTLLGRFAGVGLFSLLVGLKLLETEHQRSAVLVILLDYFLIITQLLFGQGPWAALSMALQLLAVTATLLGLFGSPSGARQRLKATGLMLLQALPVMALLFVLFPRIQGPLWRLPEERGGARTGLSDDMSPGTIAELSQSAETAFRVRFAGKRPAQNQLYWRGPVLWHFDGQTWRADPLATAGSPVPAWVKGDSVDYTVTLEPHRRNWLFALDVPVRIPPDARLSSDYQLLSNNPVNELKRYDVSSMTHYLLPTHPGALQAALALPSGYNPRSVALARDIRTRAATPQAAVEAVLKMFNQQQFYYTLEPPRLGRNSVDDFLFATRRGFCEHYASAMVFLARAMGIPARVVTGYQGGEFNPLGNYLIVRQSDAHAWTEVWFDGAGWVRVDPTAAVARERVERNLAAALPEAEALPFSLRTQPEFLHRLRFGVDNLLNHWNQWVIGYDTQRQRNFLRSIGIEDFVSSQMLAALLVGGLLASAPVLVWLWWRGRPLRADPVQAAWLTFCARLARHGASRHPHEGPRDFARRAAALLPQHATEITAIADLYMQLRYGGNDADAKPLRALVRRFRP